MPQRQPRIPKAFSDTASYKIGYVKKNSPRDAPEWSAMPQIYPGTYFTKHASTPMEFLEKNPYNWDTKKTISFYLVSKLDDVYMYQGTPMQQIGRGLGDNNPGGVFSAPELGRATERAYSELVASQKDQIAYLRDRLDIIGRESSEKDKEIARLTGEVKASHEKFVWNEKLAAGIKNVEVEAAKTLDGLNKKYEKSSSGMDGIINKLIEKGPELISGIRDIVAMASMMTPPDGQPKPVAATPTAAGASGGQGAAVSTAPTFAKVQ